MSGESIAARLYERWVSQLPALDYTDSEFKIFAGTLMSRAAAAGEVGEALYAPLYVPLQPPAIPAPQAPSMQFLPLFRGISPQPRCCGAPMAPSNPMPDVCAYACGACGEKITVRALVEGGTHG